MALAIASGVPHTVWLDDPAAMSTAARLYRDQARRSGAKVDPEPDDWES